MSTSETEPRTPNRPRSGSRPEPPPGESASAPSDTDASLTAADLRSQMDLMRKHMELITKQLTAPSSTPTFDPSTSREYWSHRIDESVTYPGEDSSSTAKRAYKQRLDAHLRKSAPIWELVSKKAPAPLSTNEQAIRLLKSHLGNHWIFDSQEMHSSLDTVLRLDAPLHKRILAEMDAGSDTPRGSWSQRNSALFNAISDTLDLSKGGSDLNIIDVVEPCNGIALYDLVCSRLEEVQSTDPLARAMQIKTNLQHIRYKPQAHGVAAYFASIKDHRASLLQLPTPKVIGDWEVVAKALRELPPIHPKFAEAANLLQLQRKLSKQETSLPECRTAFINAEIDNDVVKDLRKNTPKRKIRTNLSTSPQKRKRPQTEPLPKIYPKGSCAHHPNSETHLTCQCTNPFGFGSVFGRATSHVDKCKAVRDSIAAGWAPEATWVRIPRGYGVARSEPAAIPQSPATGKPPPTPPAAPPPPQIPNVRTNLATAPPQPAQTISPADLDAYYRVRATMEQSLRPAQPRPPPSPIRAYQAHTSQQQHIPPPAAAYPYHGGPATANQPRHMYPPTATQPHYPQRLPFPYHPHPAYQPSVPRLPQGPAARPIRPSVQAHVASMYNPNNGIPPPSDDDIISAGMRYYANQAGGQHFY